MTKYSSRQLALSLSSSSHILFAVCLISFFYLYAYEVLTFKSLEWIATSIEEEEEEEEGEEEGSRHE